MSKKPKPTIVTRDQLYERVWSAPLSKIAEDLSTRPTEIVRLCTLLHIPRPKQGYWQNVSSGKPTLKQPLPTPPIGTATSVTINPETPSPAVVVRRAVAVAGDAPTIHVPTALDDPHPHIAACLAKEGDLLSLPKMKLRAYCIEDAFLKAMEQRGHRLTINEDKTLSRCLAIGGQVINYDIYEPVREHRIPLTKKELADPYNIANGFTWKDGTRPSGVLRFRIVAKYNLRQHWGDKIGKLLESQVGAIIISAEAMAKESQKAVVAMATQRKEDEREREKELRPLYRRRANEEHWKRLSKMADNYQQAQRIRAFLTALEAAAEHDAKMASKAKKWSLWAETQLRQLDPLSHGPKKVFSRLDKPIPPPGAMEIVHFLDSIDF